jgi:hypothetical protein
MFIKGAVYSGLTPTPRTVLEQVSFEQASYLCSSSRAVFINWVRVYGLIHF